jgi:hypothetical protein
MLKGIARCIEAGLALGLLALAPAAVAQKMYKCTDASGAVVFQQSRCAESEKEADARIKEQERLKAEAARKKEDEERRKAETIQKAKDRDKAYQEQMDARAEERRKAAEAERRLIQGTSLEKGAAAAPDGSLPTDVENLYPGPWKKVPHPQLAAALAKHKAKGCEQFQYRQRAGGGLGEYLVNCTAAGPTRAHYFVWPQTESVKGPVNY